MNDRDLLNSLVSAECSVSHMAEHKEAIFANDKTAILNTLEKIPVAALKSLREHLTEEARLLFTGYTDRQLLNRRKAALLASDVYVIGLSVVSKTEDRRLKCVFRPAMDQEAAPSATPPSDQSTTDDPYLLEACADLKEQVNTMQQTIRELLARVEELEEGATVMKAQMYSLRPRDNLDDTEGPLEPADTNPTEDTITNAINGDGMPTQQGESEQQSDDTSAQQPEASTANNVNASNGQDPPLLVNGPTQQRFRIAAAPRSTLRPNQRNKKRNNDSVIYVGGLLPNTTEVEITSHLTDINGLHASDVIDIKQLRRRGFASFKVILSARCNVTEVLLAKNWPKGITARPFAEETSSSAAAEPNGSHEQSNYRRDGNRYEARYDDEYNRQPRSRYDFDTRYDSREPYHHEQTRGYRRDDDWIRAEGHSRHSYYRSRHSARD